MKMTNTKTRKTSESCRKVENVSTDARDQEDIDPTLEIDNMHWLEDDENECLANNNNGDGTDDDDDDVVNDGDTSTSFSLQECMNEFRARRIRRTSLSHHRQDIEKNGDTSKNCQETAELELINQNLCNKEQERKCKPCQNGFCYCFTSDSGDGGVNLGNCNPIRNTHTRNSRRNRRSECNQVRNTFLFLTIFFNTCFFKSSNIGNKKAKNFKSKDISKDRQIPKKTQNKTATSNMKATTISTNQLTAISSLETSPIDAPLIHIIQELRGNCVISKVKVNKHKIQANQNKQSLQQKNIQFKDQRTEIKSNQKKSFDQTMPELYTPTAPTLEKCGDLKTPDFKSSQLKNSKKCSECCERRRNGGGQLLQKRLSTTHFSYKPRNTKEAPPKPPRSTRNYNDQCCGSSESTSSSVREAERVVDDFLKKKGYRITECDNAKTKDDIEKKSERTKPSKKLYSDKRKSYPLSKLI